VPDDGGEDALDVFGGAADLLMLGSEEGGGLARVGGFVEFGIVEADGEGAELGGGEASKRYEG
jgi:hypothetical protein